jgi:hypothetical protein
MRLLFIVIPNAKRRDLRGEFEKDRSNWVDCCNKVIFLLPPPGFDLFFSFYTANDIDLPFDIDKFANIIFGSKSVCQFIFVFENTARKICCEADINDFVVPSGNNVDDRFFHDVRISHTRSLVEADASHSG